MAGHHIEILKCLKVIDALGLNFFNKLAAMTDEASVV